MKKTYIEACRGFGIILVVLGHTLTPEIRMESQIAFYLHYFIYSFHMPLFFVISGYVYQNSYGSRNIPTKDYFKKKSNRLLKPYVLYSVFTMIFINSILSIPIFKSFLTGFGLEHIKLSQAIIEIITGYVQWDIHIWFLYVLFIIVIIYYLLKPMMNKLKCIFILFLAFILLAIILAVFPFATACGSICKYMPYFLFGIYYRNIEGKKWIENIKIFSIIYIVFFALTLIVFNSSNSYKEIIEFVLKYGCGICGSLTVINVSKRFFINSNVKILKCLSEHSMSIYLYHQPFIVSGSIGIIKYFTPFPIVLICGIGFILGIILPLCIEKIINCFWGKCILLKDIIFHHIM